MNVLASNLKVFGVPRLDHASLGFLGHGNVTLHVVVVSAVAIMSPRLREVMTLRFSTIELS